MGWLQMLQMRCEGGRMLAPETGVQARNDMEGRERQGIKERAEGTQDRGSAKGREEKDAERTFTQEDIDRMIAREKAEWRRAQEKAVQEARAEAERMAKMTAEERAQAEREKRESELTRREADISRREMRAQAMATLVSEQLPPELAELINYADANSYAASLETMKKVWNQAVQEGVEARMKGATPKTGTRSRPATLREAIGQKYAEK